MPLPEEYRDCGVEVRGRWTSPLRRTWHRTPQRPIQYSFGVKQYQSVNTYSDMQVDRQSEPIRLLVLPKYPCSTKTRKFVVEDCPWGTCLGRAFSYVIICCYVAFLVWVLASVVISKLLTLLDVPWGRFCLYGLSVWYAMAAFGICWCQRESHLRGFRDGSFWDIEEIRPKDFHEQSFDMRMRIIHVLVYTISPMTLWRTNHTSGKNPYTDSIPTAIVVDGECSKKSCSDDDGDITSETATEDSTSSDVITSSETMTEDDISTEIIRNF
jgi:hypothetical protein